MSRTCRARALGIVLAIEILLVGCSGKVDECKAAVEERLTSPGSAVWGDFKTDESMGEIEIRGRVDSDNAFGASRRTYFICHFEGEKPAEVAFGDEPFDDLHTRLRDGRGPIW